MSIRVGINGFGRIGRNIFRCSLNEKDFDFVAVNDVTDTRTLAHLLKYDSVAGKLDISVETRDRAMIVGHKEIRVFSEKDPSNIPWNEFGIDVVVESTGFFTKRCDALKHIHAGAKKVIITAPACEPDITLCLGVNEREYDSARQHVISNASCTTNCLGVIAKVLESRFGIVRGYMTTVHSYTNDQKLLDFPHKDLRRARAGAISMVPTTSGAVAALGQVLPELKGKLDGISIRVPTPNVSLIDLVVELKSRATSNELNIAFKEAATSEMKGILSFTDEPLVSIDYRGNEHSAIVDGPYTTVLNGTLAKVLAWYDNEWGYSCRVRDLIKLVAKKNEQTLDSRSRSG